MTSAYVSIRQHTSAYVSIRQHTSAYVSKLSTLTASEGDQDKDEDEEEKELDAVLRMCKSDYTVLDSTMDGLPKRIQDSTVQQASRWLQDMHIFKLLFDLLGASLQ